MRNAAPGPRRSPRSLRVSAVGTVLAMAACGALGVLALAEGACGGDKFSAASVSGDDSGGGGGDSDIDSGTTSDGGIVSESGRVDAFGPSFCVQNPGHAFCDDFDRDPSDLKGGWDSVLSAGIASLTLDPANAKSPPNALFVTTKPGAQNGATAALQKSAGKFRVYHASFDIDVESYADPNSNLAATAVAFELGQNVGLTLSLLGTNAAVVLENTGTQVKPHSLSKGLPVGRFVNVKIDVTIPTVTDTQGNVHITFDGTVVLDDHLSMPVTSVFGDAKITIGVVPYGGDAGAPWSFRFDNVLLDRGP